MLTYDKFKEKTIDEFMDHLSEDYQTFILSVNPVVKVNRTLDGLSIMKPEGDICVAPTVYIDDLYKAYLDSGDADAAIQRGADIIMNAMPMAKELIPSVDCRKVENRIIFQLINTDQNRSLLNEVPHREFMDMSLIYRWVLMKRSDGIYSTVIRDDIAESMGLTEEQLYDLAYENTKRILKIKITSMRDLMFEMMMRHAPAENEPDLEDEIGDKVYVISNDVSFMGAIAIVYPEILDRLSDLIGSDYYILPVSIHELIAIPAIGEDAEKELTEMVESINRTDVDPVDVLSDSVYFYSRADGMLHQAQPEKK